MLTLLRHCDVFVPPEIKYASQTHYTICYPISSRALLNINSPHLLYMHKIRLPPSHLRALRLSLQHQSPRAWSQSQKLLPPLLVLAPTTLPTSSKGCSRHTIVTMINMVASQRKTFPGNCLYFQNAVIRMAYKKNIV